MTGGRIGALIRAMILALGRIFYPQIVRVGDLPAGPLLLVANHPNGLLDGVVLILALGRPVAFLAKSTFFASPLLRPALLAFGAVPVFRPGDRGRAGGAPPGVGDPNAVVFEAARALLADGGALAIFPEGSPSPDHRLLPLKTGAARIALGAEQDAGWQLGLQVVPVGLWFEEQTRAGSRVVVLVGPPVPIADLRERSSADPAGAVRELTERLRDGIEGALQGARAQAPTRASAAPRAPVAALALLAPLALIGLLLALPGAALAWLALRVIALRHRATVGTSRLVAWVAGLALGWPLLALGVGAAAGGWAGVAALLLGPPCGYLWMRWRAEAARYFVI